MLRFAPLVILLVAIPDEAPRQVPGAATAVRDTVHAGDPVVDASRLRPFSIERRITLARGDSTMPFGLQSERLTNDTLDGRPVYLDVLTFETPSATTVDSSWIDAATLRPLRMHSSNKARVVTLEFDGRRVRGRTVPAVGDPTSVDEELAVRPFEWNMFGLALSALPLRPGYRAKMPVYVDRFGSVIWYTVEVVRDTNHRSVERLPRADVGGARHRRLRGADGPALGLAAAPVRGPGAAHGAGCEHDVRTGVTQDKSATEQSRTRPSMMRRANSRQPVMAASCVE